MSRPFFGISVNLQTIAAIGKSKIMFRWTLIKRSVGLVFMIGGLFWFGMKGLLVGVVLYNWFCYFVNIGLVSKYIGYKWNKQLLDLLPVAIASFASAVVALGVAHMLHWNMYPDGIVKLFIFLLVYLAWSFIFKPVAYTYTLTNIPARFKFWEKIKREID